MKISVAQFRSKAGDIAHNQQRHLEFVARAVEQNTALIAFPELSLTGYEPKMAQTLATTPNDPQFDAFQTMSDQHQITITVGMPIQTASLPLIGMLIFRPNSPRGLYAKQFLHEDEWPFFSSGSGQAFFELEGLRVVPAICYESLQPEHADIANSLKAKIYLTSVVKSLRGMTKAQDHYPAMAFEHRMTVICSNGVGPSDDFVCAGRSGVWSAKGKLVTQMDEFSEGILTYDLSSETAWITA